MYLESAAEREEYVLNKTGLIFRGTSKNPTPLHWNFAQVSNGVCVLCACVRACHACHACVCVRYCVCEFNY